ncbi:MAG: O-antigen ligase family protein [Sulfuricurvum sp.]
MFTLLNVLVFFLLTGYAVKFMFSKPSYVYLSKTKQVLLTGREKFLVLTMATGMVETNVDLAGINLSALRLMVWIGLVLLSFFLYRKSPKFNFLIVLYTLYTLWLLISFSWALNSGYAFRGFLKYLYPLLIMMFAATFVHSRDFIYVAIRWLLISSITYSILLGGFMTDVLHIWSFYAEGMFWPMSTLADYLGIMSGLAFLLWWRTKQSRYLWLIGWFFLSSVLQSVRTGLLAVFLTLGFAFYLRYRAKAIPYIMGLIFLAVMSVLFVPQVREKMFYDSSKVSNVNDLSSVDSSQIDSNGRFAMWGWTLGRLYDPQPLMGSGIGSAQYIFYETNHPFAPIKVIHNDYVQILADTGQVGLVLYALFVIISSLSAARHVNNQTPEYLLLPSFLVVTSFTSASTTMMTDNVVLYVLAVLSMPFIFVGIMIAYRRMYYRDLKLQRLQKLQKSAP